MYFSETSVIVAVMPYSAMNPHLLDFKSVQLEPFVHQVGGHSGFFHINNETLCKPLVDREHFFYENLPANLKEFIPEYRGTYSLLSMLNYYSMIVDLYITIQIEARMGSS